MPNVMLVPSANVTVAFERPISALAGISIVRPSAVSISLLLFARSPLRSIQMLVMAVSLPISSGSSAFCPRYIFGVTLLPHASRVTPIGNMKFLPSPLMRPK